MTALASTHVPILPSDSLIEGVPATAHKRREPQCTQRMTRAPRYYAWMGLPKAQPIAATLRASDSVGCAWHVRAMSSAEAPYCRGGGERGA